MIGLDTNALVRLLVRDDLEQAARAKAAVDQLDVGAPGFISLVVLVELHWVLRSTYGVSATDVVATIEQLLDTREFVVQESDLCWRALRHAASGADFADALVAELGAAAGCTTTVTFDRRAARLPGMTVL